MQHDSAHYDRSFVFDQSTMINKLSETLIRLDHAVTEIEKQRLRTLAKEQNEELFQLHGIDLGGF